MKSALRGKDNNRYNDLSMMKGRHLLYDNKCDNKFTSGFHHTGDLENFNSLGNKYRAKAYVYG